MRARDLAEPFPTVTVEGDAMEGARAMGQEGRPGIIVCDAEGHPYTVLPGSQVLRFLIPPYIQENPALARVLDEEASDELLSRLKHRTVRELLPDGDHDLTDLPVVDEDATTLEVAAVMARMHSPVVAVVGGSEMLGAVTVSRLLRHLLPPA